VGAEDPEAVDFVAGEAVAIGEVEGVDSEEVEAAGVIEGGEVDSVGAVAEEDLVGVSGAETELLKTLRTCNISLFERLIARDLDARIRRGLSFYVINDNCLFIRVSAQLCCALNLDTNGELVELFYESQNLDSVKSC